MKKRIALAGAVLAALILLPMATGEFATVTPAHAAQPLPEPGTLILLGVGLVGMAASKLRRGR